MAYTLHAPGTRKGNTFWIIRGSVAGREFEISTRTPDKGTAERLAPGLVAKLLEGRAVAAAPVTTFAQAAERYIADRKPGKKDEMRLRRVMAELGPDPLNEIRRDRLSRAADTLLPGRSNATQNREVFTPAAAVLHYAAENGWCAYQRIRKRKETTPPPRPVGPEVAELLIANAAHDPDLVLLLSLIFFQGRRVGDALKTEGEGIDLGQRLYGQRIGKTDQWKWSALHPRVFLLLANRAPLPKGRIMRWHTYQSAWFHLEKLRKKLGITFTFHQARHSFATWLRRKKVDLRGVQLAGDWKNIKSVVRYQDVDVEEQRELLELIGNQRD